MKKWIEGDELCKKITITLILLIVYKLATYIPLPGVSFKDILSQSTKGIIHIVSAFTGANFSRASILSLGIMPYISSSIFIQFISFAFPFISIVNRKINYFTRWLTIIICLLQSPVYLFTMTSKFLPFFYMPKAYLFDLSNNKIKAFFFFICMLLLTIGTLFCLWIGEKITNKGIYNGVSLIIITAILTRFPDSIIMEVNNNLEIGNVGFILLFLYAVIWLIIICFTLSIMQIICKVPLQYVSYINTNNDRFSINKGLGFIPIKISVSGVMPIIFSEAIMFFTKRTFSYLRNETLKTFFEDVYGILYNCIFIILMIVFTIFYRYIAFPINKMVYNLKINEAFIPRVKPGKETINYLNEIFSKTTFPGAILLSIIATFPIFIVKIGINRSLSLFYGGTSLFIIVGVILETLQHIHTFLHTYKNFKIMTL